MLLAVDQTSDILLLEIRRLKATVDNCVGHLLLTGRDGMNYVSLNPQCTIFYQSSFFPNVHM